MPKLRVNILYRYNPFHVEFSQKVTWKNFFQKISLYTKMGTAILRFGMAIFF
jgi:hypothetical protein